MRHTNTGLSEDDLSRLTGSLSSSPSSSNSPSESCCNKNLTIPSPSSSSSTSSSSSSSSSSSPSSSSGSSSAIAANGNISKYPHNQLEKNQQNQEGTLKTVNVESNDNNKIKLEASITVNEHLQNAKNAHDYHNRHIVEHNNATTTENHTTNAHTARFNSTYLPEIINPLEWQKSRKRKERLDSTSSITQDRKLQRSNSEELLPEQLQSQTPPQSQPIPPPPPPSSSSSIITQVPEQDNNNINGDIDQRVVNRLRPKNNHQPKQQQQLQQVVDDTRRVSSEDFKCSNASSSTEQYDIQSNAKEEKITDNDHLKQIIDENDGSMANRHRVFAWTMGAPIKDMARRSRYETSPARSQRHSPIRFVGGHHNSYGNGNGNSNGNVNGNGNNSKYHRDSDDSECEHERRRSSERFCKIRAPPGRKVSGITKKSSGGRHVTTKLNDENAYKYDLSTLKYERRGFVSKKSINNNINNNNNNSNNNNNDHNDNNLIDFGKQQSQHQQQQHYQSVKSITNHNTNNLSNHQKNDDHQLSNQQQQPQQHQHQQQQQQNKTAIICNPDSKNSSQNSLHQLPLSTSIQEALPWDRSVPEDQTPVLSRRYGSSVQPHLGDNMDTAALLSKVKPFSPQYHKQAISSQSLVNAFNDGDNHLESMGTFRTLTSLENVRTRELMQVIPSVMSFQSPEERLKHINKRLTALKKKLAQLEETYEHRMGYRPSQADRLNDKYMKNIMSELCKLRKERHELKADPMGALGFKIHTNDQEQQQKLEQMKETLREIQQTLSDKRENRSDRLDDLSLDQLVQEKSSVQYALLHFELLYGRPSTKEERDIARPLYDRYRQLKRLVSRSVISIGSVTSGAPELPTILEHEAMVFEAPPTTSLPPYSPNDSTETTNSPSDSSMPSSVLNATNVLNSDDSTTTTITTTNENTIDATKSSKQQQQQQQEQQQQQAEEEGEQQQVEEQEQRQQQQQQQQHIVFENINSLSTEQLWEHLDRIREEKKLLKRTIREYETIFEEQNGRKMLKNDRRTIEDTYAQYKEKKATARLLQALLKKQISR